MFRGGWQSEMAAIALSDDEERNEMALTDRLRTLREHSLLTTMERGERMRYGMLETLRAFGQETLVTEETRLLKSRHAAWFLEFACRAQAGLRGPEQTACLDRLEEEQENLRAALQHLTDYDPLNGLRLANALYWFWYVRGYYREGEQWLMTLTDKVFADGNTERAWGLLAAGHFANCQSDNALAMRRYEAARALFEQTDDPWGQAHVLCRMGNAAQEMLDVVTAQQLCARSVARFRALNDSPGLILALFYYASALAEVNSEQSLAAFQEALVLADARCDIRFQALLQHCCCKFLSYRRGSAPSVSGLPPGIPMSAAFARPASALL